ncbi:uncharacterized protein LACBIDRAFT_330209 [Laccaria bicolor S238N-H82]|uniref:Predicted protein n=1 Tax=Laccaria bicolor (strain S238N-H82 / ATCC MYA-4686) TaxID=486041 RepID=B0DJY0_LACBS|nr:uncharacterized protein LACBIDRAFT_330209 [Laccaria bicolor S238N-H82]EDR04975.1 predicted protein [Laccaria bicolor S238N-H82]|eukprot:XP_001884365.1 predicted protein [Laccaria bicolor S238N-H82]
MSSSSPDAQALATAALHLTAGKYFQIAAFVMLVYDQIYRWYRWILYGPNRCDRFVAFEGSSTVAMVAVCEYLLTSTPVIMILRVYALYGRSRLILAFLSFLWVVQVTLSSIGMRTGFGCIFSSASPLFQVKKDTLGPSDLKAVGASFSQLITATMISRLVLNLRSLSYVSDGHDAALLPSRNIDTHKNAFVARTIVGNLGEDMETFLDFN